MLKILFCIFIEHNFYIFVKTHNEIFTCKDIPELLTLKYPIQSIISQSLLSDKPEYIGARGARERSDKKIIFPDPAINSRTNLRQRSFANNISSRKISLPDQPWLSHFPSAPPLPLPRCFRRGNVRSDVLAAGNTSPIVHKASAASAALYLASTRSWKCFA